MKEKKSNFGDKIGRNTQRQKESHKGFGYLDLPKGVSVLKLKEGVKEVQLDFLPYVVTDPKHPDRDPQYEIAMPETQWYRRPFKVHQKVGANKEQCVCLKSVGKKCPICDYQEKRRKEGADKEEIKLLYPKPRSLYIVIPLDMDKVEEIPHIWDMSDYLFQNILNEELETDGSNNVFPDLASGKTLSLKLRWKDLGDISFPDVRNISFDDREAYPESMLKKVPNLDEVLKVLSYESLEAKFFELEEEEDGGKLKAPKAKDEEDEEPPRRKRPVADEEEEEDKPVARRRPVKEEEEDDAPPPRKRKPVDEEEDDDKPVRSKRPVAKDDEEEDDEEEDDKPTRTKRPTADEEEDDKPVRTKSKETPAPSGSNKCPHGHKFGVDADDFDECETCDVWTKCLDKKEGK